MLNRLRTLSAQSAVWPPIDAELEDVASRGMLSGRVLNAGAGWRRVAHLVKGELTNQDLTWPGDTRTDIHIYSPIHSIPRPDGFFDAALCIAVLEHVINPDECVMELFRVLKPGGRLIASVPFLQPEHKIPTDFQRYTRDGLSELLCKAGFVIEEIKPLYSVYHTLHWLVYEWLHMRDSFAFKLLRPVLLIPLVWMARRSTLVSTETASAFRAIALKPTLTAHRDRFDSDVERNTP